MKKIISVALAAVMLVSLVACAHTKAEMQVVPAVEPIVELSEEGIPANTQELMLGPSALYLRVPTDYEVDWETDTSEWESLLSWGAQYISENSPVKCQVECTPLGDDETLEERADYLATMYQSEAKQIEINGIAGFWLDAVRERLLQSIWPDYYPAPSADQPCDTRFYLFENNGCRVEFEFTLNGENAENDVERIIKTLRKGETEAADKIFPRTRKIQLGPSALYMQIPNGCIKDENGRSIRNEFMEEDADRIHVGNYYSYTTIVEPVNFDVYYWALSNNETLEDAAAAEAKAHETKAEQVTLNGIDAFCYNYVAHDFYFYEPNPLYADILEKRGYKHERYNIETYMFEDDGSVIKIEFRLDGKNEKKAMTSILDTLEKAEAQLF